jgi:dTDP-4-amino-4,6-dideoxygalactose transaminase
MELPAPPAHCAHNGHLFHIKLADQPERAALIAHLAARGIQAVFHYVPLHSAPAGRRFGRFHGQDRYTTRESERLLRLPMYYELTDGDIDRVCAAIEEFFA